MEFIVSRVCVITIWWISPALVKVAVIRMFPVGFLNFYFAAVLHTHYLHCIKSVWD